MSQSPAQRLKEPADAKRATDIFTSRVIRNHAAEVRRSRGVQYLTDVTCLLFPVTRGQEKRDKFEQNSLGQGNLHYIRIIVTREFRVGGSLTRYRITKVSSMNSKYPVSRGVPQSVGCRDVAYSYAVAFQFGGLTSPNIYRMVLMRHSVTP